MNSQITQELKVTATLSIPHLVDQPFMGSGCCVIAADVALQQELESWPQVVRAEVSPNTREVAIFLTGPDADLDPLLETLESLGYPASVESSHNSGRR